MRGDAILAGNRVQRSRTRLSSGDGRMEDLIGEGGMGLQKVEALAKPAEFGRYRLRRAEQGHFIERLNQAVGLGRVAMTAAAHLGTVAFGKFGFRLRILRFSTAGAAVRCLSCISGNQGGRKQGDAGGVEL